MIYFLSENMQTVSPLSQFILLCLCNCLCSTNHSLLHNKILMQSIQSVKLGPHMRTLSHASHRIYSKFPSRNLFLVQTNRMTGLDLSLFYDLEIFYFRVCETPAPAESHTNLLSHKEVPKKTQ